MIIITTKAIERLNTLNEWSLLQTILQTVTTTVSHLRNVKVSRYKSGLLVTAYVDADYHASTPYCSEWFPDYWTQFRPDDDNYWFLVRPQEVK